MNLDQDSVRNLFPRADDAHVQAMVSRAPALFERFGISDTNVRRDFFLAQIGHESGGLTRVTENLNYSADRLCAVWPSRFADVEAARPYARNAEALANCVYADRLGNGATESGEGWRYRGRGYIQLTGKEAYRRVSRSADRDFVADPDQVGTPEFALLSACAFWSWKSLNTICDGGNFVSVTRRVNGGTHGLADRRAWLDKVRRVLASDAGPQEFRPVFDIVALQRALQEAGYPEAGAADGVVGPRTTAAVVRFRHEHGMPEGGIDAALMVALDIT